MATRSARLAAARICNRSRSTLDVLLWAATGNIPCGDKTGRDVPARVLNRDAEGRFRKRSLPQPFGIAFAVRSEVEKFTGDRDFHDRPSIGDAAGSAAVHS